MDQPQTVMEALNALDDKLSSPETWTQRSWARNAQGTEEFEFSSNAVCWCVLGCLMLLTEENHSGTMNQAGQDTRILLDQQAGYNISKWNDADGRTFQDVKDLLSRAKTSLQEPLTTS
jgi:hypothetical protein